MISRLRKHVDGLASPVSLETAVAVADMLVRSDIHDPGGLKMDEVKTCEYTYARGDEGMIEAMLLLPPPTPSSVIMTSSMGILEPYVFEGEHFWDTTALDDDIFHDEQSTEAASPVIEYWGLAYEDTDVYYFDFDTGRAEWTPPPSIRA
ncbi:hypothetical protein DYB34_002524 [Aphanomyces astaci]|uniref:WW domain-containing protein n=3 Tax=Aphanomyces astaci TaxID=112090 RepID=A0A3R6WC55_APHAT|nr:hypothetical protein DYB34_002524 [Aphanomyces astaci]